MQETTFHNFLCLFFQGQITHKAELSNTIAENLNWKRSMIDTISAEIDSHITVGFHPTHFRRFSFNISSIHEFPIISLITQIWVIYQTESGRFIFRFPYHICNLPFTLLEAAS